MNNFLRKNSMKPIKNERKLTNINKKETNLGTNKSVN